MVLKGAIRFVREVDSKPGETLDGDVYGVCG